MGSARFMSQREGAVCKGDTLVLWFGWEEENSSVLKGLPSACSGTGFPK